MTKLEKFVLRWLNDNYNHMEPFLMEEYPDYIFHMKNGKCILQHSIKNGYVYVSYSEIWKFLESMFCMEDQQIRDLTKKWVEEHYKVGVTKTSLAKSFFPVTVEEHYKVRVDTTAWYGTNLTSWVEEQYKVGVTKTCFRRNYSNYKVEERYKMKPITTKVTNYLNYSQVEGRYEMEVKSTLPQQRFPPTQIENQYKEEITTISDEYSGKGRVEERYKEIQTTNNQLEFYSEKDVEELYEQNTNIN